MDRVPDEIVNKKIRQEFCKARQQINRRTLVTDAKNKMLTEWTQDKMIEKAEAELEEQRMKNEMDQRVNDEAETSITGSMPEMASRSPSPDISVNMGSPAPGKKKSLGP